MPQHLYRYRPARAVLDEFHELERQQIYFSPLRDLNDPMEGFRDVVWRGDAILWTNLLRHYVRSLTAAASTAALLPDDTTDEARLRLAQAVEREPPAAAIRRQLDAAAGAFLGRRGPRALVAGLSRRTEPVRRQELLFFLRLLHPIAMSAAFRAAAQGASTMPSPVPSTMVRHAGHQIVKLMQQRVMPPQLAEGVYALNEFHATQMQLIHALTSDAAAPDPRGAFLMRDFPLLYLESLSGFLYPDFYTASFVEEPTNAAMWGAYADSHRGVCLMFRAGGTPARPTLELERFVGGSAGRDGVTHEHRRFTLMPFSKVTYGADQPEVDFFGSLGVPSMQYLLRRWFSDGKGGVSPAWSCFDDEEAWRTAYWARFEAFAHAKTPDWAHEAEHRLVLKSFLHPLDTVASRQLTYRFADLTGIVFGMRMSVADKLAVLKIVEAKCDAEGRKDFELYQAIYDHLGGGMALVPLNLLTLA